jgi:glycerophosphoryl diester phosphodiesterase
MKSTYLDWLIKANFAHRGLYNNKGGIPENSLLAFKSAMDEGYAIALDVQVISDQEVIVFHDATTDRLCNKEEKVINLNRGELLHYKLLKTDNNIPLLNDVLRFINGKVPLLIVIKKQSGLKNSNLIILNTLLGYRGNIAIQSFDPWILRWFAKNAPLIPRGQISSDFKTETVPAFQKYMRSKFMLNIFSKPHFLAYDIRDMPNQLVAKKRKNGSIILGWTVTSAEDYERVSDLCDNIIFEGFKPLKIG